jgi:hypothetical protein
LRSGTMREWINLRIPSATPMTPGYPDCPLFCRLTDQI